MNDTNYQVIVRAERHPADDLVQRNDPPLTRKPLAESGVKN